MNERQVLHLNPERLMGEQIANFVKEVFEKYNKENS